MLGRDFWGHLYDAQIPDSELMALGENIGRKSDDLSNGGQSALTMLAQTMRNSGVDVTIDKLFDALKDEMPGLLSRKSLLEGLAGEYSAKKPYDSLSKVTREYLDAVGRHLPDSP